MATEEIGLNEALEAAGVRAVETDLGEYIIQLRGEMPSHIIGPAVHVTVPQVRAEFGRLHGIAVGLNMVVLLCGVGAVGVTAGRLRW